MQGSQVCEKNNFTHKGKRYLSNWPLVSKKGIRTIRLYNKGMVIVEFNNEFLLVSPKNWFYVYIIFNELNPIPVYRILGYKEVNSVHTYKVIEKTGELFYNERKIK